MKIIEMLRMSEQGIGHRAIAAGAGCGKTTVSEVLKRCRSAGVNVEVAGTLSDEELAARLYPERMGRKSTAPEPDWQMVHNELAKNPNLNLQFMWEEYRMQNPEGLSYNRFCVHAREYRKTIGREVTYTKERRAGEIMEVDWMGDTLDCVVCSATGARVKAHFFVTILGYSHYPYVEAFPNEQEQSWITGHVNALHYYGGVPKQLVPDNCKTAVTVPKHCEPTLNGTYWELAQHYNVAIIPARVRKPKDKAVVEQTVGWLETWLLGKLRNQTFYSFEELNKTIRNILKVLSAKPFQKRPGSRTSEFYAIDKPALGALPLYKYEIAEIKTRTVGQNYHLEYAGFHYSVPHTLYGKKVLLRATAKTIEVLDTDRVRQALHPRQYIAGRGRYVTNEAHMPPNHLAMREQGRFDGERYRSWAKNIGMYTYRVINAILTGHKVEQQGYKSCMGILQSTKQYTHEQLEMACRCACEISNPTYSTVMKYLKQGVKSLNSPPGMQTLPTHENLRGNGYYR